ncbi:MAG: LicD family protein [Paracoccaceae bacterium]
MLAFRYVIRLLKFRLSSYLYSPFSKFKSRFIDRNGVSVLRDVAQFLEAENIKYWLDGGTLLGVVRDNGIIDGDIDIDIGVITSDVEALYSSLVNNDFHVCYFYEDSGGSKCVIRAEKNKVGIDFEIFKRNAEGYYRDSPRPLPATVQKASRNQLAVVRYEFDYDLVNNIVPIHFCGVRLMIPEDYDKYLTVYYSNWKVREKLSVYTHKNFSQSVERYEHHNSSAFYKKDEFLYFSNVAPSTIKLGVGDVVEILKSFFSLRT